VGSGRVSSGISSRNSGIRTRILLSSSSTP
jgi:hypothetical protein